MTNPRKVIVKTMTVNRSAEKVFEYFGDMKNMENGGIVKTVTKAQDGWWEGATPVGKARFRHTTVSKEHGILDHFFVAAGIRWDAYVRVVPNNQGSTVSWTFTGPEDLTNEQFENQLRMFDLEMENWKQDLQK